MKTTFLLLAIVFSLVIYSQDTTKFKQIDNLVNVINTSDYKIQKDTIINDQPQLGLSIRTYITMVTSGTELKKYINNVHATTTENGISKQLVTINAFYFDHNKLIKVEESAVQGNTKIDMLWYYDGDKPIYYTVKSKKAQERAEMLLTMAKNILAKAGFE